MIEFAYSHSMDMHIHHWLHYLAGNVMKHLNLQKCETYESSRSLVIQALFDMEVPINHRRYVGSCTMAKLGYGGGL